MREALRASRSLQIAARIALGAMAAGLLWLAFKAMEGFRNLHWSRKSPRVLTRVLRHRLRQAFDANPEREQVFREIALLIRFSGMTPGSEDLARALARLDDLHAGD